MFVYDEVKILLDISEMFSAAGLKFCCYKAVQLFSFI